MKGLAHLLKALYPSLDWSTPEATLKSIAPQLDVQDLAQRFNSALLTMHEAAERQARIERMLEALMQAYEHAVTRDAVNREKSTNARNNSNGQIRRLGAGTG